MAKLDLSILGSSGLQQSGGVVSEDFLPRLQGISGVKTYREMSDNSSAVGALLFAIRNLILQAEWRVEPASDKPEAKEQAGFVESCLEDMAHTWDEFLGEALTMLVYGWTYFEIVYLVRRGPGKDPRFRSKHTDGKIGWRKFSVRGHETLERWQIDEDGGIRGMHQMDPSATKSSAFIPIEKAILFRIGTRKNNPEGRSILRNAVLDYHYLKRISQIEATGIERDLCGLPTIYMPAEYLAPNPPADIRTIRDQLFRQMSQIKRDEREFAAMPAKVDEEGKPTGWDLQLLTSGGRRQFDTNAISNRYTRNILMSTLAEVLMLGAESGSWSLASSKTKMLSMAIGAIMDSIASVFTRFGIARLMQANGVPPDLHPWMTHGDIETPPLDELGRYATAMTAAGIDMTVGATKRKLLEAAKLPTEEEELLPGEGAEDGEAAAVRPETALNGAQVQALLGIVTAVGAGEIQRDSAITMIASGFPFTTEQAGDIVGKAVNSKTKQG